MVSNNSLDDAAYIVVCAPCIGVLKQDFVRIKGMLNGNEILRYIPVSTVPGWTTFAVILVPFKRCANSSVNKMFANFETGIKLINVIIALSSLQV